MKHVFISYVHDNFPLVERLCNGLKAAGINVWLDRDQVQPGTRWQNAIRDAIANGAYFIACFSKEYNVRSRSYMNEELTLAIEELRRRPTEHIWFIPVLVTEGEIPSRTIGAGEDLHALQWVELYKDWNGGIERIISVIEPSAVSRPTSFVNPIDGSSLELVPGGTYRWGRSGAIEEIPVKDFYVSLYPVTNAQYRRFLQLNASSLKQQPWVNLETSLQSDKYSGDEYWVGGITYDAAEEYCKWTHMRLLTLFELEYFYFRTTSGRRRVFGINCGYDVLPMYWTSTRGHEIGKEGVGPVVAPVSIGMSRLVAIPVEGAYFGPAAGLRCAASLDMVKDILGRNLGTNGTYPKF
jgi:hypothetical protein